MHILLGPAPDAGDARGAWRLVRPEAPEDPADAASPVPRRFREVPWEELGEAVRATLRALPAEKAGRIRWVLPSCREVMPQLLASGVSPDRCWDLALCQRILTGVASFPDGTLDYAPTVPLDPQQQERPPGRLPAPRADPAQTSLFDAPAAPRGPARPDAEALAAEFRTQEAAVRASPAASRLRLLLAAESQGGVIAQEIEREGLPWDRAVHEALLEDLLGPRPPEGRRPQKMQALAERIAEQWGLPTVNPDSPQELLRAMQSVGITVDSTRRHALLEWAEHGGTQAPRRREMIAPVLEYKGLYRLWTANGWHWLDEWVRDGRFHARYVVGGVVTGRWAAHGGGALQIPHAVRDAVRADPGWVLTVADASQVEPRILAAMARDRALAVAGQGRDLYEGIARLGERTGSALTERKAAKVALLGAMYGASTGEAGALVPHLRRMFPEAIGLVERAASVGERGGQVRTWLGRTSPLPDADWSAAVADVSTAAAEARSVRLRRAQGRFTRNFIVQGTAAEWALCWMGEIRRRLRGAGTGAPAGPDGAGVDDAAGPLRTRLVFFVHDEVVLHGPAEEAPAVRAIVQEAAAAAGRLLFGLAPVDFPLTVAQVTSYAEAK